MHVKSALVLFAAIVAIVAAQAPSCPPPVPLGQFTVDFTEVVTTNGLQASFPNTFVYSGATYQQRFDSRTPQGVLFSTFIVNATINNPNDNGKFWIVDYNKIGLPEACSWSFIMEVNDPIDINPPLIPYLAWAACEYKGTAKISGQNTYYYHMTNPKSLNAKMEYYINTQTLLPVVYSSSISLPKYNNTETNYYKTFQMGNPDPSNFVLPLGTPKCVEMPPLAFARKLEAIKNQIVTESSLIN